MKLNIFNLFDKDQKKFFKILITLMLIASVLEMLNIAIIIPIINSFLDTETYNNFFFFKYLNIFDEGNLKSFIFLFGIFFILKTFYLILITWIDNRFIWNFRAKVSLKLYNNYLSQTYNLYKFKNSAELLRNTVHEIDQVTNHLRSLINVILEVIVFIGLTSFLLFLNPLSTFIILSASGFIGFIFYFLTRQKINDWSLLRQDFEERRVRLMQEGFNCIKEINLLGRINFFVEKFKIGNIGLAKIFTKIHFLAAIPRFIFELLAIMIIVFYFSFFWETKEDVNILISIVAIYLVAFIRILPSINRILSGLQILKYTNTSVKLVCEDIQLIENTLKKKLPGKKIDFNNSLDLKIKDFSHDSKSSFSLKNINIEIKKNNKIGLIGKSGSGKSTILDILVGIITSDKIDILIDGKSIKSNINNWQKMIGYIPQQIFILNDTLKNNILFGLEKELPESHIEKVIEMASLSKLVKRLPYGINHNISDKGTNLSGGEIQRIGIARALICNPEILIFDESTSSLDTITENSILDDIFSFKNKTIIMISHRLNSLRYCDTIYHLDEGLIINEGSFQKFREIHG